MKMLDYLKLFLRPAQGEPTDPPADPPAEDPPADAAEPAPDLDVEVPGDPPLETQDQPTAEQFEAAQAAEKAERARADRAERELAELRGSHRQAPRDQVYESEEERLRDPKITPLEKWQIEANRELRRGRSDAQFALAQAQDIADKTAFARISITNAPLFKRYESKVEEELAKMRAQGRNAPRETIMDWLVGRDMRAGAFTKKAAPKEPDVKRGKLPGARSDVGTRGTQLTKKQQLEKKLEGQQI